MSRERRNSRWDETSRTTLDFEADRPEKGGDEQGKDASKNETTAWRGVAIRWPAEHDPAPEHGLRSTFPQFIYFIIFVSLSEQTNK